VADTSSSPNHQDVPVRLLCVGVSHHTADLSLRERIHLRPSVLPEALADLRETCGLEEAVILSTCNRFEIYSPADRDAAGWIGRRAPEFAPELSSRLTTFKEKDAVRHLFSVAGGLEAQVLGETQILGQVKEAYEISRQHGMTGQILNMLFQRALTVGKRIRAETRLAETPVSVSSVAVRLCEKIFGRLEGRRVLVVGAGEISTIAAEHLHERGARLEIFSTRSREPAEALARSFSAPCLPVESLAGRLPDADIVISGSGAPHLLLTADAVRIAQKQRAGRPLFLVDLAIPRDIDPASAGLDNVFLYNLDDLDEIARDHRHEREQEIPRCEAIIREETESFWDRLAHAQLEEPLRRFHARITSVVEEELRRSNISPDSLESLKKSIPNRVLSEAFAKSRRGGRAQDRQALVQALKEFFGL